MSESLEGARVAATRQKAGRVENCEAPVAGLPGVGGVKAPAATALVNVIVVFANLSEARFSQDAATAGEAVRTAMTRTAKDAARVWEKLMSSGLTAEGLYRFM